MASPPDHDLLVVGGGASGLMAAGRAAAAGARVLVLEKMPRPARKLALTGKGRCNLTNIAPVGEFLTHFPAGSRFLRQAFARFFSNDLLELLGELGVATVTERGGRVFPASSRALDVVDALAGWSASRGVRIRTRAAVRELLVDRGGVLGVRLQDGHALAAPAVVLAAGGASYPGTGSTGDGYGLAAAAGHTLVPIRPALVPLETHGERAARLQELSLKNVSAALWVEDKKHSQAFGEMIFTHFGLSGPIILTLSRMVVDALDQSRRAAISIDLKPALDHARLNARLQRDLDAHGRMQAANLLKGLLPAKLIPLCLEETGIPPTLPAHQVSAFMRKRLRVWLKDLRFPITGHRGFDEAIVTAGGVDTREVDPRTMQSRIVSGLFLCGELLDVDADTGGYNLQAAFSTGWLAGSSAAATVLSTP